MNSKYILLLSASLAGIIGTTTLQAQSVVTVMGQRNFGQLGLGNATSGNEVNPVVMDSTQDNDWTYISAETISNLGIKKDGFLWAWGRNINGQLGDGTTTQVNTPKLIDSGNNVHGKWVQIDMGGTASFGIREDGSLWSWGDNSKGKLGIGVDDNTLEESLVPVLVDSGTGNHGKWTTVDGGLFLA